MDSTQYAGYQPHIEADDVETMIAFQKMILDSAIAKLFFMELAKHNHCLHGCRAEESKIDALLLHGYAHDNMFDIIKWQNNGGGAMIMINSVFDRN